jgi:hypothetical protein
MGSLSSSDSSQPQSPEEIIGQALCGPECQKQKNIQSAFQAFQTAEENKDSDPATYAWTRFNYMSVKNGPEWAAQEKQRILKQQVEPILKQYNQQYVAAEGEYQKQRKMVDAIEAVEQKQSNIKNSLKSQMEFVDKTIGEKKAQTDVYQRLMDLGGSLPESATTSKLVAYFSSYPQSFVTILDIIIAVLVFFILVIVYRKSIFIKRNVSLMIQRARYGLGYGPSPGLPTAPATTAVAAGPSIFSRLWKFFTDYLPFWAVIGGVITVIVYTIRAYEEDSNIH